MSDQTPSSGQVGTDDVDVSLLLLSLQKTPWERLAEHDEALEFADSLRDAVARLYEQA